MSIAEFAESGRRLEKIGCSRHDDAAANRDIAIVVLHFEGGANLALEVDGNSDELVWGKPDARRNDLTDLHLLFPSVANAYGLSLTWSWEMKNHQGYFDALQLEFTDGMLAKTVILQFKAAASAIRVFEVTSLQK